MIKRVVLAASLTLALAACQDDGFSRSSTRHLTPIPAATMALMSSKGMSKNDPILIRAFKKESEMEIWKRGTDGRYALLKTYPICRWSGQLGPKVREGDRQVPEGFYTVTPSQMNPNSAYYLSFDTGYPNAFDRSLGRNGGDIMVHGSCSSRGCFAMTDQNIAEIYAIAREAFASGQRGFQFQAYPFRMTAQNLAQHRLDPNIGFWKNLKEGSDYFDVTKEEPRVSVAGGRYQFIASGENAVAAIDEKQRKDEQDVADLVAHGEKPVKLVYHDGDSHESFRSALANAVDTDGSLVVDARGKFGAVSRPEGLSSGPQQVALDETTGKAKVETPSTALAFASMNQDRMPAAPAKVTAPAAAPTAKVGTASPAAAQPAAPTSAANSSDTPFYKRMFNGIGDLFSSSSAQPAAETAHAPAQKPPAATSQRKAQVTSPINVAAAVN
ncbi:L,D-transpeptidase family protein [Microvirga puerhi]|uniref:Murein L,D-transpeptidase n=1 Tax=Microvirga puerhi TaxID=2876078 RepID=A0ABS7VQ53_9HYPH|nr:murein L,D-transpeptidase family protein [Microvirga puerhi]MBZ6077654.1 murein L,D-transpeptidase [Microvirga puerhi]